MGVDGRRWEVMGRDGKEWEVIGKAWESGKNGKKVLTNGNVLI